MRVIDLTHVIRENMPVYPGTEPPQLTPANTYEKDGFKEKTQAKAGPGEGTLTNIDGHGLCLSARRTSLVCVIH